MSAGERGRGFGVHRGMDTSGAVLGLAVAALIIYVVQGGGLELGLKTYQWLVLVGIIPAVLAVLVLLDFVREKKRTPVCVASQRELAKGKGAAGFDTHFKLFLVIMAVFTLGNSSDFFVVLRAQNLDSPDLYITLMLVLFNITYAAFSVPAGILSDRLGRRRVIVMGWVVYAVVYLGFAVASSLWQVWLLFACYGIYYGIVEGVVRAFVAMLGLLVLVKE
ncbi:MFS transporter [Chloroflexota bacterium]